MKTKQSGYLVVVKKDGRQGRTYGRTGYVNGKIPIYLSVSENKYEEKATLFLPSQIKIIGFID